MSNLFNPCFLLWDVKLLAGKRMIPCIINQKADRLYFTFGFNRDLMDEIKSMEGSKYHGYDEENPRKIWSVKDSEHNRFQIKFLAHPIATDPNNPYYSYKKPLVSFKPKRNIYNHQTDMASFGFTRRQCILAAEPGVGKTLTAIEIMEAADKERVSKIGDWIWVAPRSALVSVELEFIKWRSSIRPIFVTYEGLIKLLLNWPVGKPAPLGVIFDEASRLKNPTAKRTQAAQHLADNIRKEHGAAGFIILMSGTPAPKSPADWFSLCRIACPGYLREGTIEKFKQRLSIVEMRETFAGGGTYPHLVAWRDDEKKCNICGLEKEAETHSSGIDVFAANTSTCHPYEPSINEVHKLYQRMQGLTSVKLKSECLSLPVKQYREIICKPTRSILNAASAITTRAPSTITALILLRELSDGFQYVESVEGTDICPLCLGERTTEQQVPCQDVSQEDSDRGSYEDGSSLRYTTQRLACTACSGIGFVDKTKRTTKQIPTPKEEALRDLLEEYEDIGRVVIYGGFTGTIDRVCSIVKSAGWNFICVDGRGWRSDLPINSDKMMVQIFQDSRSAYNKVAFIGHPGSAGMGLTLTASPVAIYYSNDFNGESRAQSEERIYRLGMDIVRGATIIDLIHLATDKLIIDNLKKKKKLQAMTMGELQSETAKIEAEIIT